MKTRIYAAPAFKGLRKNDELDDCHRFGMQIHQLISSRQMRNNAKPQFKNLFKRNIAICRNVGLQDMACDKINTQVL